MRLALQIIFSLCLILCWTGESNCVKILSVSFFGIPSHRVVYDPLLAKLAERGHDVTVIGPHPSKLDMKNVKNIQTIDYEAWEKEMDEQMGNKGPFEIKEYKLFGWLTKIISPMFFMGGIVEPLCRRSYELPIIQDLISGKEKYDLILFSSFFNDCVYGLVHHLNTTTILLSQVTVLPWMAGTMGTPSPPSFVPFPLLGYTDHMTFPERLANFIGLGLNELTKSWLFNPKMEKIYREYINPNLPGIKEIEANASIVLCNSHVSFIPPRPLMPDIIDVGGMNMRPPGPVKPKELEDFLNGAKDGFILFSMGSGLKGHKMPEKYRKIFLNTFAKLRQRVLWKWETEKMNDLPPNVRLSKWLPQQDVLGHKNIRLFITHGGHGGTSEAIYHGVPLLGIPILGDQAYNMKLAKKKGFAESIELPEITEELLTESIMKVLNNPSYGETAKKLSSIYKDQIDHPLDRAVYNVEYVIRHQGARHLRSAARDLSTIQYYSLDVIATILASLLLTLYLNFVILRKVYRKFCGGKKSTHQKKTVKKTQ